MILADYKENAISDVLPGDYADLFVEGLQKTQHVTIVPTNFIDLEEGKTYLFYLKDGMIINGGYGVFEQISEDRYQNVISGLEISKEKI